MRPRQFLAIAAGTAIWASTPAVAQDQYETFVGQYSASVHIARTCKGITTYNTQGAGSIAKKQDGLRRQKVLRLLYYSKTKALVQAGHATLTARGVDPENGKQTCRFARSVAGQDDPIGRFLRVN